MINRLVLLCIFSGYLLFNLCYANDETILNITVTAGSIERYDSPVHLALTNKSRAELQSGIQLFEVKNNAKIPTRCQVEMGHPPRLWWILSGSTKAHRERSYQLVFGDSSELENGMNIIKDGYRLRIQKNNKDVLQYNYAVVRPPKGVSQLYERSGFIHPLWSPSGEILTKIQPEDHYHHYGLWNPWTKTRFKEQHVDFWNLGKGEGTVRFSGFLSNSLGPVFSGFKAHHEHVKFVGTGPAEIAMNEIWDVRVWNVSDKQQPVWLVDLTTTLNCADFKGIDLLAYRYGGGLGFRATDTWTATNCTVLTSEGKKRETADGTRARWCRLESQNPGGGITGILFMSHLMNREHPEPMRVWPSNSVNGKGYLFFEFCPIRHVDWRLDFGQDYVLSYRFLVYEQALSESKAERYWEDFVYPPQALPVNKQ